MEGIIYRYKSPSGKYYIGQTINEQHRRRVFNTLNCTYGGKKIDTARKKYGPENFEYTVLMEVKGDNSEEVQKYLNILEVGFIKMYDSYNNGYNSTEGGDSVFKITEEIREKMRNSHIGKQRSEESKLKQSKNSRGRQVSEETRKKISKSHKGKKFSPEHIQHIQESRKGYKWSDETKKKMSEIMKGRQTHPWTKEMKNKLSESMIGRKDTDETKKKKSESAKLAWEKRKAHK